MDAGTMVAVHKREWIHVMHRRRVLGGLFAISMVCLVGCGYGGGGPHVTIPGSPSSTTTTTTPPPPPPPPVTRPSRPPQLPPFRHRPSRARHRRLLWFRW